ncbi:glycoside hydrolase family 43 protein [Tilletiaria anomala UBC 951]|uniref:Glycoside hydrolase family 43 protein n=1 Tax=Tilletiaria anomala (strain ATCC 24038 / CBS 436.72 / UBC 951) TaxID=1037660 RepID=A0A066VSG6_TILAU|nr:glycoside hydrolase family 43 protein [Tilletiaria anomala UBC 951]KDN41510.1 glycoside hydrolase family 43 protein [Tilletiaria anomala UBC 951]
MGPFYFLSNNQIGSRPLLSSEHTWQTGQIEAPHPIYEPNARFYILFFSSGTFIEDDYKIGWAINKNIFGPWKSSRVPLIETDIPRGIVVSGGQYAVRGVDGNWFICFHIHNDPGCKGGRRMCVHHIMFNDDGLPRLAGKPVLRRRLRVGVEEEDGILNSEIPYHLKPGTGYGRHGSGGNGGKAIAQKVFHAISKLSQ